MRYCLLGALLLAVVINTGCEYSEVMADFTQADEASEADDPILDGKADDPTAYAHKDGWAEFARGIGYRQLGNGDSVFIGYGGYGVKSEQAEAWVEELYKDRLTDLEIGRLYAVKGPRDAGYGAREIPNSALANHIVNNLKSSPRIVIAAHSSGSFVAHELLAELQDLDEPVLKRVWYFDLDGGSSGLDDSIVSGLALMRFVYARDPEMDDNNGLSRNGSYAKSCANNWHDEGAAVFEIDATGSGCDTRNCLHDAVITAHPHDPKTFKVALDYTDFSPDRPVVTAYLDLIE